MEEREEDPELADELLQRSGYEGFIETLNQFVEEKALSSKLTTDLYVLDNVLDKAIAELTPGSVDADIDALEENLKQQRHFLVDARTRLQREVNDIFTDASSRIREIGIDAASVVDSNLSNAELEERIGQYSKQAETIVNETREKADEYVHQGFIELGQSFVDMDSTEFNQQLKIRLVDKYDNLPDSIKKVFVTATDLEKQSDIIVGTFVKSGFPEMLSLTDASVKTLGLTGSTQNLLKSLNAGTMLVSGATKAGQAASRATSVIGIIGIGLQMALQLKEDYEEQLDLEAKKNNRQNIRSGFNNTATALEDYASDYVKQCVAVPLELSVRSIENNISDLREARTGRSEKCIKLEKIQKEIQALISGIHDIEE